MNRRMLLAGAAVIFATPASAQADGGMPIVTGQSFQIASNVLGEARKLNVWLPGTYGEGQQRYPVLYLLDGGEQEDFHHISGLANISGAYGVTREFIVVGVESGRERRHHMTFLSTLPDDVKAIPLNGGAAEFRRYLAENVIPWVEANFRTSPERVVMGESLAGLFVVETLLRQPGLFEGYIAIDPSLWWDGGSLVRQRDLPGWTEMRPRRRVFLALSNQGPEAEVRALADGLGGTTALTFRPMPEETHGSIYHPAATYAVRALFAPPPPAP